MPGLAFLAKKSWHTSNLNNQEKVWIAEQKKAAEEIKTKELTRQIQQEREEEELQRMASGGGLTKRLDRGIDWMYQATGANHSTVDTAADEERKKLEAEEYLLGKEYNPTNIKTGDFASAVTDSKADVVIELASSVPSAAAAALQPEPHILRKEGESLNTAGTTTASISNDWSKNFRLRHEDPMYHVLQRKQEKERNVKKKRDLYERVVGSTLHRNEREEVSDDGDGDDGKRRRRRRDKQRHDARYRREDRKQRRKEKRIHRSRVTQHEDENQYEDEKDDRPFNRTRKSHHRRRRRRPSYSRSTSRSRSVSRESVSHDNERIEDRKRRKTKKTENYRLRNDENYSSDGRGGRRERTAKKKGIRSKSRSNDSNYTADRQNEANEKEKNKNIKINHIFNDNHKNEGNPKRKQNCEDHSGKVAGYGLQGKPNPNYYGINKNSPDKLGPDKALLVKKRREVEEARSKYRGGGGGPYRRHRNHHDLDNRSKLSRNHIQTEKNRDEALKTMQEDAYARDEHLAKAAAAPKEIVEESYHEEIRQRCNNKDEYQATFIRDLTTKSHDIVTRGGEVRGGSR